MIMHFIVALLRNQATSHIRGELAFAALKEPLTVAAKKCQGSCLDRAEKAENYLQPNLVVRGWNFVLIAGRQRLLL